MYSLPYILFPRWFQPFRFVCLFLHFRDHKNKLEINVFALISLHDFIADSETIMKYEIKERFESTFPKCICVTEWVQRCCKWTQLCALCENVAIKLMFVAIGIPRVKTLKTHNHLLGKRKIIFGFALMNLCKTIEYSLSIRVAVSVTFLKCKQNKSESRMLPLPPVFGRSSISPQAKFTNFSNNSAQCSMQTFLLVENIHSFSLCFNKWNYTYVLYANASLHLNSHYSALVYCLERIIYQAQLHNVDCIQNKCNTCVFFKHKIQ